jgi:autotransporter family porin
VHTKSITGTLTTTVVLGEGNYGDKLTVTSTGAILPSAYGAEAVYASAIGVRLTNNGRIVAGSGVYGSGATGGAGGAAVDFAGGGELNNKGLIFGGMGGNAVYPGAGGAGGIGVEITSGEIVNQGRITGGGGGSILGGSGGAGASAIEIDTGAIKNTGTIIGGLGGKSGGYYGGVGGVGVHFTSTGTLTNKGTIDGGFGNYGQEEGGSGAVGVQMDALGTVINHGTIKGGSGGNAGYVRPELGGAGGNGVDLAGGGFVQNFGDIQGGAGGVSHGGSLLTGGAGILVVDGSADNSGIVSGGEGAYNYRDPFALNGGAGVNLTNSNLENSGTITGGGGGGYGVSLDQGGTLTNLGTILGGVGALPGVGVGLKEAQAFVNSGVIEGALGDYSANYTGNQYNGGAGAYVGATSASNSGRILGGGGGNATYNHGGDGGVGVTIAPGTIFTNTGTIIGGTGGNSSFSSAGNGGAAVVLNGSTFVDGGTIDGGSGGNGSKGNGEEGVAIQFGGKAGTLEISATAKFGGLIEANVAVKDTLILESKGAGALSGLGTTVTGFTTIEEQNKANWTLEGNIAGNGTLDIGNDATLSLNGTVSIATLNFGAGGNDTLNIAKSTPLTSALSGFGSGDIIDLAGIQATSLKYASQTLTLLGANGSVVDTLIFDGKYTQADFALQAIKGGTELIFAGTAEPAMGLADFLTTGFGHTAQGEIGFAAEAGGAYGMEGSERNVLNSLLLHYGNIGTT